MVSCTSPDSDVCSGRSKVHPVQPARSCLVSRSPHLSHSRASFRMQRHTYKNILIHIIHIYIHIHVYTRHVQCSDTLAKTYILKYVILVVHTEPMTQPCSSKTQPARSQSTFIPAHPGYRVHFSQTTQTARSKQKERERCRRKKGGGGPWISLITPRLSRTLIVRSSDHGA